MKKFFEKILDFLYDSLDYIIILAIITIVVIIIGWRIDLLFVEDASNTVDKKTEIISESNEDSPVEDNTENKKTGENITVRISIPEGSSSSIIGTILEEQGLVSNKDEFVNKAKELNLDTKLRSGNYEIAKDSSLEDIVNLITK